MDKDGNKLTASEVVDLIHELAVGVKAKLDKVNAELSKLNPNKDEDKLVGSVYVGALTFGAGIQDDICDLGEAVDAVLRAEAYFDEHGVQSPSATLDGVPVWDASEVVEGELITDDLKPNEKPLTKEEEEQFIVAFAELFGVDPDTLRQ